RPLLPPQSSGLPLNSPTSFSTLRMPDKEWRVQKEERRRSCKGRGNHLHFYSEE
ncbi:hypothetical protein NDU88_003241, partial [Pleurodeles waltl]